MNGFNYSYIFLGLAIAYALQLLLTAWQAKRFFRRLKEIRKDGLTSIGLEGGKWKGRTYAVLVVDDDKNILHAEKLSGMTIFSKLESVPELIGVNACDLLTEAPTIICKKKVMKAFQNAAEELIKKDSNIIKEDKRLVPENNLQIKKKMTSMRKKP